MLDGLVGLDEAPCGNAGLVSDNGVAVGRIDFEGAIWEVNGHVAAQVASEIILFLAGFERVIKPFQPVGRKQLLFGRIEVLVEDYVGLDDFADLALFDPPRRVI